MKILILFLLLFCSFGFEYEKNQENTLQLNNHIKGKWKSEQIQIQYVVDSHLVHEQEITPDNRNVYDFGDTVVEVKYPDGKTAQGTYSVVKEAEESKLILQLSGTTTTYLLISVTPTHLVWQRDLENVTYTQGQTLKAAERAIYVEVLKK